MLGLLPALVPLRAELGLSPMQEIVAAHVAFNATLVVLAAPFAGAIVALVTKLLPNRERAEAGISPLDNPSHLDHRALENPAMALMLATREVLRMADWVELMLRRSINMFDEPEKRQILELSQVDAMHSAIKQYLVQLSRGKLDEFESQRCMEITSFTVKLEHVGDIVEKNLLRVARKHLRAGRQFSDPGWTEITELHARVLANLSLALNVFVSGDEATARQLVREKERFRELQQESGEQHMERLRIGTAASIESSATHMDVMRDLDQINTLLVSTAYPLLEESGALLKTRLRAVPNPTANRVTTLASPLPGSAEETALTRYPLATTHYR
jgi:phosphate:Na+ symporter